jgi:hypothetical protein
MEYAVGESNSQTVDSKSTRYASSRQRRKVDLEGVEPSAATGPLSAFRNVTPVKPKSNGESGFEPGMEAG